ncbi:MAG: N-acetyl-gamma-glutamyl-phosphate reductase [Turicibacter sp.]|nr:N-acetyl-gamma-glutamyl-phosphate reductase [Turicibacter sp.]
MKVYIDGNLGTTGLELESRLKELAQKVKLEFIQARDGLRKDLSERKKLLNAADVVFLCLPDGAAKEAVAMVDNPDTVIIDASTAHRTHGDWAYGFPELSPNHFQKIATSNRISVPGCHATGFSALVYPLVEGGFIPNDGVLSCHSLTGYSGGGKSMIEAYEQGGASAALLYGLDLGHKHLPEMMAVCGLLNPPIFTPVVVPLKQGMVVTVPLAADAKKLWAHLNGHYENSPTIRVKPFGEQVSLNIETGMAANALDIYVFGHGKQTVLAAHLDNLGKGSSGAAVECLKVRFGIHD